MKHKKCKVCKKAFEPRATTQVVCSWQCSIAYTNKEKEKRERKDYREKKEALKTRREWLDDAQTAFNAYIRERDKDLPCISCGKFHQGQWHAGHYRSVAAASQHRYSELNVHKQCQPCNTHKSGNAIEYRINLVKKIGVEKVEWLENNNEVVKWTIEQAKEIKELYNRKLKLLRKGDSNE